MSETIVVAMIGSFSSLVVALVSLYFAFKNLKSDYRGKLELEIISKQIAACEALWEALSIASKSEDCNDKVFFYHDNQLVVKEINIQKLYDDINKIFHSSKGLYFSKELRKEIFTLRDFIYMEILQNLSQEKTISKTRASQFDGYVQNLRIAIRKEINTMDLNVAQKGPLS